MSGITESLQNKPRKRFLFARLICVFIIIMFINACSESETPITEIPKTTRPDSSVLFATLFPTVSIFIGNSSATAYATLSPNTESPDITQIPIASSPLVSGTSTSDSQYFTSGDVIISDTSYKSSDLNIVISNKYENGVNYYVADCRMKQSDLFMSAFAKDTYAQGNREYPLDIAIRNNAILAINGDYYGDRSQGYVIRNGILYRNIPWNDIAAIFKDGTMKTYYKGQGSAEDLLNNGAIQVYSFGPMLLGKNGKALAKFSAPFNTPANPRTGIGYIEPNHFILIVVDGRGYGKSKGLNMSSWAKLFQSLGCKCAYNLDGGGSSIMIFMNKIINHPCDLPPNGQRAQSDMIYLGEKNKS
jgi:exopolysaccharide biosynthesis protein